MNKGCRICEQEYLSLFPALATDEQFDVKIKNELLAKAIETLTERKKEVIFLSYFQGMSDAAIARKLNLVRSTVCEHRTRSLELLKNTMEEYGYENYR